MGFTLQELGSESLYLGTRFVMLSGVLDDVLDHVTDIM